MTAAALENIENHDKVLNTFCAVNFEDAIDQLKRSSIWDKESIVDEFFKIIPEFEYHDNGKYLDGKM